MAMESVITKNPTYRGEADMKSYVFRVVLEPDDGAWRASVPELEAKGASTWGKTREEALRNIQDVVQMVLEEIIEDGEEVPTALAVANEPAVAVNVE